MQKKLLSLLLALCMVLTILPPTLGKAANEDLLPEDSGYTLQLSANETKALSFVPQSDGFYVFSFVCTDYMDNQELGDTQNYFQITNSRGSQLECIYIPGMNENYSNWDSPSSATSTNDYIVKLQQGNSYTVKYTNPKNEADELVVIASSICAVDSSTPVPIVNIPGAASLTNNGNYNIYSYSDNSGKLNPDTTYTDYLDKCLINIKINSGGWYSFGSGNNDLSESGGYGCVDFYTSDLHSIARRDFEMNHPEAENRVPASIYLPTGEYVLLVDDYAFDGLSTNSEFVGFESAFASVSINSPSSIEMVATENYITFTPPKNGTYTFLVNISEIDTWSVDKLKLYSSDGKEISGSVVSYDSDFEGKLSNTLSAGVAYYLEVLGYGSGTVSVSSQSEVDNENPKITNLYPTNGATFDFADTTADTRLCIFFDREVAGTAGRAQLDFSKGTLEVRKAENDELVYSVKETTLSSGDSGVSNDVDLWMVDGKPSAVRLENVTTVLDYSTDYYVTMPTGFIKFADGTASPAIEKGTWSFITNAKPEEPIVEYVPIMPPKSGTFKFHSDILKGQADENISYSYNYDESWFLKESTEYQHDFVRMSIRAALAAYGTKGADVNGREVSYSSKNIKALMDDLGYINFVDAYKLPDSNTIGYAIGSKNVRTEDGEEFSIIMVAVRGGGYFQEWGGNFNVGLTKEHNGFMTAANSVVTGIKKYLNDFESTLSANKKIWIMGYSRGAATTNLVAARLNNGWIDGIEAQDVYAFCFACPQNIDNSKEANTSDPTKKEDLISNYANIINVVNPIDVVPKVVMSGSGWEYSRYGKTYYLPSADINRLAFLSLSDKMSNKYEDLLAKYADIQADTYIPKSAGCVYRRDTLANSLAFISIYSPYYVSNLQSALVRLGHDTLGKESDENFIAKLMAFNRAVEVANLFADAMPSIASKAAKVVAAIGQEAEGIALSHYGELYLSWLDAIEGDSDYIKNKTYRVVYVNCPVDVEVLDADKTLVGKITDDKVMEVNDGIGALIDENGQKIIILPHDTSFTVNLTATGNGTVTYTATEYNLDSSSTDKVISYYEVDVSENDTLVGLVENLDEVSSAQYPLCLNGSDESLALSVEQSGDSVQEFSVEISKSGNGTVAGGGNYVSGEFVKVSATANSGESFLGWYVNNTLASSDAEYRFLVDKNINIVAKFTENTTSTPGATPSYSSDSDSDSDPSYSIKIPKHVTGGTVKVSPSGASKNQRVTLTVKPNSGYELKELTVSDSKGNKLELTGTGDGKYTFRMPGSKVSVDVSFVRIEPVNPTAPATTFTDVHPDAYYYDAVQWAVGRGITSGTSANTFSPDAACTRAQMMTFLWRAAGSPAPKGTAKAFADIDSSAYYYNAVRWAVEQGITSGTTPETFSPNNTCTRAQNVTFLYRSAGSPAAEGTSFTDVDGGAYYADAVAWAVERGVTNGTTSETFSPDNGCTRAQIVTFLYRANN